jgi:hypothetical protein
MAAALLIVDFVEHPAENRGMKLKTKENCSHHFQSFIIIILLMLKLHHPDQNVSVQI